ncbi:MAG: hypothetical protein COB14_09995 [Alphaproteobacteria bacterium]|nr:MAG: hypothetical protein COB14_09995 [Alphaproteobacteria bacterium]
MTKKSAATTKHPSSNITIVDGKLILSLPDAQMPVVWQMDLGKAQSSVFTIQEDKKQKNFTLILKNSDDTTNEIASFKNKQDAVDILMETSSVIQNAHGQIKPSAANNNNGQGKNDRTSAILALALIFVLGLIWTISASGKLDPSARATTSSTSPSGANARDSSGVPVSADDFLSNR